MRNINAANQSDKKHFSLAEVILLGDQELREFWHIWLAILAWMSLSYVLVHVAAFLISVLALRHHNWMSIISIPFLSTALLSPCSLGAVSSFFLALTFFTANKSLGTGHCMLLGILQTVLVFATSFLRILATL